MIEDKKREEKKPKDCEHEWKQVGTTPGQTHLITMCTKCGAKREIELFP